MDKAEKLRKEASELYQEKEASFQRSDTDGFLSQWALGLSAQQKNRQADIEENGGVWDFPGLYDIATGARVNAKLIRGQYGLVWIVLDDATEQKLGRKFIPYDGSQWDADDDAYSRSRVQKKLGLIQKWEQARAKAVIEGSGTGLSGTAWVAIKRIDGK